MPIIFCKEMAGGTERKTRIKEGLTKNNLIYLGRFERVIRREVNCEEKYSTLIWTVIL